VSIGEDLAEARRRAGLSVAQVSEQTCIRETFIRAIERDDYGGCGGDFYARGHIRAIAQAVGTDPVPLITEYDAAHRAGKAVTAADLFGPARPVRIRARHRMHWGAVLALALAAVVVLVAYHLIAAARHAPGAHPAAGAGLHRAGHQHGPRAAPAPAPAATTPARAAYAHIVVIRLTAIGDCWVGFTTPAGEYLSQAYVAAGTSKRWAFRHAVDMRLGNPGGIRLTVDGKHPLPPGTIRPITLGLGLGAKISP
jgi:transcriptional regulator with XRE-family HTH domain